MNFTILGRSSNAGPVHTDRPSLQYTSAADSWKKASYQPHHLNPSKSKLNVRNSLNKTNQSISYSNNYIDGIRASGFVANPISTYQHIKKQSIIEDKNTKNVKETSDHSFQLNSKHSKDSFYKCSTVTPTSFVEDDRKKKQPSFLRHSVKDGCLLLKLQEEQVTHKENSTLEEIKSQIMALTKRVFINQDQICKLKEKKQKDKKIQTLEQQFTQFQIQMFDILKKNSNFFADFQSKIDKNTNFINEIRDKIFVQGENQELLKKLNACEARISQLNDITSKKDENINKMVVSLLSVQQNQIKSLINDQMNEVKLRLDKNAVQKNEILLKLIKLEEELKEKDAKTYQYKIDSRKCYNPMIIENRQVLIVKQNDKIRDSTKQHLNYELTPKKDYNDYLQKMDTPRKENRQNLTQNKRQITLKQKLYYIDSQGYLLDQNKYYLLNSKNQQILIPEHLLKCLRQNNMLSSSNSLSNSMLLKR